VKVSSYDPRQSDYLNRVFLAEIDRGAVLTILELGAHDGRDTLELYERFRAEIHAFECHPDLIRDLRERLRPFNSIHLVERAVWDSNGRIPFYPVIRTVKDGEEISNRGASSCFLAREDYHQSYEQAATEVDSIRLDSYCAEHEIDRIDLLCMDVQGAALHALRGMGHYLRKVRYLIAEIEKRPLYHGQDLYPEVKAYLESYGFLEVAEVRRDAWFSDFMFVGQPDWMLPLTAWQRVKRWLKRRLV